MATSLCRALLDGWCGYRGPRVSHSVNRRGHGVYRYLRGIPDTKDGTQSGAPEWFQSVPRRDAAQTSTRSTGETQRVYLQG